MTGKAGGSREPWRGKSVSFSGSSGPSRGTKVSREEIEAAREKNRRAQEAGIYLSERQRAALIKKLRADG